MSDQASGAVLRQDRIGQILSDHRKARALLESLAGELGAIEQRLERESYGESATAPSPSPRSSPHTLEIRCLGSFSVLLDGVPLTLRAGGKSVAVMKVLAARGTRPTPRDLLLEVLWPETEVTVVANRLGVALHALRRMAGELGSELVAHEGGDYRISTAHRTVIDTERFEELWQHGQRLEREGLRPEALDAYDQAEQLYRGDYLEDDLYEDWTYVRREYLRDLHFNLLLRLSVLSFDGDDDVACATWCRKLLQQDPLNEEAYRVLMVSYVRRGQPARALRWFEVCERVLKMELGMSPSATTVALRDEVQAKQSRRHG